MVKQTFRRLSASLFVLLTSAVLFAFNAATDALLNGTPICSNSASQPGLAFDGNASTVFSSASTSEMQWVGLDLGTQYVITRVGYTPAAGSQGADRALLCLFEGANSPDFMDAVPLHLITTMPSGGTATTADVSVSRGFRYVRYVGGCDCVDFNENNSDCHIAELKFYGHAGEGDDTQFYQITNLPTLSVHVQDEVFPSERGEDFESQSLLIYDGGTLKQEYPILFRRRGNYPDFTANKSYRIKYNDVVDGKSKSHHMMRYGQNESPAKAKKWVLISSYRDKTLMRNPVAWAMSKRGEKEWTPWSQVVDLIVNGDYRGTYTLADAVTVDSHRINITDMTDEDLDEESITGGYSLEVDNRWNDEPVNCKFKSSHDNPITINAPDEDVIQPEQLNYIRNAWNNMEDILFGANYSDETTGLRSVIDVESFLRWFLISEFNGNTDMICQVFLFKERYDDLFYTGPIWDADLALEDDINYYPGNEQTKWTYKVRHTGHWDQFVSRLLSDPYVFSRLREIWAELRDKGAFDPDAVAADVDSLRLEVRASATLNHIRWPFLNQWTSDTTPDVPGSWEAEVNRVKNYVYGRVAWMDNMLSYGTLPQKDGIYQIASASDLVTFSQIVSRGETNAKAELVADIDMANSNDKFQPIGTSSKIFTGSLNGKGHTIRNFHITGENNSIVGLFGYIGACTLTDIVFDETCSVEGTDKVGMLVGYAYSGTATISGIENHGLVKCTNSAGAIVGYVNSSATINITNSSNTGAITSTNGYGAGAIVGASSSGTVKVANSYNIGTVTGTSSGKEFAYGQSLSISNCWDYTSSTLTNSMTPAQVDNGYLCYNINANAGSNIWRQNLDNNKPHDAWPVLKSTSGKVYEKDGGGYTNINSSPSSYRYYNLVITKLQGGSSGCIQFSEFDILNELGEEVTALSIYDGTESNISEESWENVADNSTNTKYCMSNYDGYAYFLFDAGSEVSLSGYRLYTANDTNEHSDRNPSSWKLYGSNTQLTNPDDAGWELIDERINDMTMQATQYTPYDFSTLPSLTLANQYVTVMCGERLQLQALLSPSTIQDMTLKWSSSDASVATVNAQGVVIGKAEGTATITVSAVENNTLSATCTVTVVPFQTNFRYYQLAIDAVQGSNVIQFSEFDLLDKNGNEIDPLSTYHYTGSHFGDESQENLFDNNTDTKYCGSFSAGTTLYIYIDAGTAVELSGYRITTANDNNEYGGRSPLTWSLLGSNTKSQSPTDGTWTLIDRHENDYTIQDVNFTPFTFTITYPEPLIMGDVNGDGAVNVMDVVEMVSYIMENPSENFDFDAADFDGNGTVNVMDLVNLIDLIMSN